MQVTKFKVHVVVVRPHEQGAWEDDYEPGEEGKEWRWADWREARVQRQRMQAEDMYKAAQDMCGQTEVNTLPDAPLVHTEIRTPNTCCQSLAEGSEHERGALLTGMGPPSV